MDMLNFEDLGDVLDDEEAEETKFEKFGAFHKTNVVFLLDLTHKMLLPSKMKNKHSGKKVSMAYACLVAIRQGVLDMIKHSSLGGGGRDRVAILGLMHKKNVVLLDMQLPSAETMKVIDDLLGSISKVLPVTQSFAIDLGKAFDMSFTLLKDLPGDAQIFVCTGNDDPCDTNLRKGVSEKMVVCSKAMDLTQNHMMSIKLLAVPLEGQEKAFDVGKFWREIVSDQGQDDRAIIENLYDLTQHVCSLTRPTAIVVPNGSNMKLRVRDPKKRGGYAVQLHVNLYALSRSRDLNPSKTFRIDVDNGHFVLEARVRNGKVLKGTSSDMYTAIHEGESTAEDDDANVPPSTTGCRSLPLQTLYQRKKVLKFRERDMKVWNSNEIADITRHNSPRCIEIVGFIRNDKINREFRRQSPQYLTLAKNSEEEDEASYWCSLWHSCRRLNITCVAILYLRELNAPKQVLLTPHSQVRDPQGVLRLPNGFYVHHLPYRDRVYVEVRPKQSTEEMRIRQKAMGSLQRSLEAISMPFFYPVRDKNAENEWRVLEALALDQAPPRVGPTVMEYPPEIKGDIEHLRAICATNKDAESKVEPIKPKRQKK
ncbi:ATP-dependent DNA helicase 2 subunit 1-like isoform X1 [Varroa destructor]|uniref:Ku domain-containing protein n=2 Tax=Varroa destructor TaxID=109461 RepID=A0A7M7JY41_VARDE|nr:ATP-dependent DNA helicase 2 subunit 1-like isoform X1 [Varroa destructor]